MTPPGLLFLFTAVRMMPASIAARDTHPVIAGGTNAAVRAIAASMNSIQIMRFIRSRFHTSA